MCWYDNVHCLDFGQAPPASWWRDRILGACSVGRGCRQMELLGRRKSFSGGFSWCVSFTHLMVVLSANWFLLIIFPSTLCLDCGILVSGWLSVNVEWLEGRPFNFLVQDIRYCVGRFLLLIFFLHLFLHLRILFSGCWSVSVSWGKGLLIIWFRIFVEWDGKFKV